MRRSSEKIPGGPHEKGFAFKGDRKKEAVLGKTHQGMAEKRNHTSRILPAKSIKALPVQLLEKTDSFSGIPGFTVSNG